MSHEIGTHDKQQGMEMAWHGLTEVMAVITLATCWLSKWDVFKRPLFRKLADGTEEKTEACEVVCTDNENIRIGKTVDCESYYLLTNQRFLSIVQATLEKLRGATVASVGSIYNRARIFISLALPPMTTLDDAMNGVTLELQAAGRTFKFYLTFISSHDKSCTFNVVMSSICAVCANTVGMILRDKNDKAIRISIPHTKNMAAALEDVPAIIDAFFTSAQKFADVMNALAAVPVSVVDARAFFAGFLAQKDATQDDGTASEDEVAEMSTRRLNRIDRMTGLFLSGKGNNGQNLADVFSAITDFYSHESVGGIENAEKQFASSEFGNGATMKAAAFALMQDDKKIAKTIALGYKELAGVKE